MMPKYAVSISLVTRAPLLRRGGRDMLDNAELDLILTEDFQIPIEIHFRSVKHASYVYFLLSTWVV